ncbi:MAG: hypothetical protein ACD_28C00020G0010 [uncultured bacterium]|nr:MAG: hypothetical protein ACD_28C00020G0010 [uncultured bacterium]KKT76035.1 MAG: hypothetical protein UW70_C0023G0013 [Candidatus Peregrinibacteria bacterium GW2011_GWA2_44_7]
MQPSYRDESGEYHLLYTFTGAYPDEHFRVLQKERGRWDDRWNYFKVRNFLGGPDSRGEMEEYLGLPHREIICTLSKTRNAVSYHLPYGLVLSGEVRICFNGDSGLHLSAQGNYEGQPFEFTREVTVPDLAHAYAEKYRETVKAFTWDEVVLKPGSSIVGAFHDPIVSQIQYRQGVLQAPEHEYSEFMEKCKKLGLPILEVEAKYK